MGQRQQRTGRDFSVHAAHRNDGDLRSSCVTRTSAPVFDRRQHVSRSTSEGRCVSEHRECHRTRAGRCSASSVFVYKDGEVVTPVKTGKPILACADALQEILTAAPTGLSRPCRLFATTGSFSWHGGRVHNHPLLAGKTAYSVPDADRHSAAGAKGRSASASPMRSASPLPYDPDTTIDPPVDTVTDQLFSGHLFSFDALGDTVSDCLVDVPPILERAR